MCSVSLPCLRHTCPDQVRVFSQNQVVVNSVKVSRPHLPYPLHLRSGDRTAGGVHGHAVFYLGPQVAVAIACATPLLLSWRMLWSLFSRGRWHLPYLLGRDPSPTHPITILPSHDVHAG